MNRIWLGRLLLLPVAALLYFAADWGYIGSKTNLALLLAVLVLLAIQKRRGRLPPMPAFYRRLPLWRIILIGAGLVLASLAWLIFGILFGSLFFDPQNAPNAYVIMVPFAALVVAGLVLAGGGLGIKLAQLMWDRF